MKAYIILLALAATALANTPERREDYDYQHGVTTVIKYTTTTICPITATYTTKGTTYCVTEWTTSTVTVTDCGGCEDQVTTIPGHTVTHGTTTEVEVTYETLCPTTETICGPTKTYLTTYTKTSTIVTHVPTTIYETVPGKDVTRIETEVDYSTLTSVYPVTKVTIVGGKEETVTFKTTKLITTKVPSTIYETVAGTEATVTVTDVFHSTVTTVYPITKLTTINGKEETVTHTKTEILETKVPTTVIKTVSETVKTISETDVHYVTKKTTYPVTHTTMISGSHITQTYDITKTTVEKSHTPTNGYPSPTGTAGETPIATAAASSNHAQPVAFMAAMAGVLALF